MIDLQSSATALRPCPFGASGNSQQHARVIYGWVRRPLEAQSPERTAEILSCPAGLKIRSSGVRLPSVSFCSKICVLRPKIVKASKGYLKLLKANKDTPRGRALSYTYFRQFTVITAFYRLMTPNTAFFQEEKDCLFFMSHAQICASCHVSRRLIAFYMISRGGLSLCSPVQN
jgi:hypothetical protein